MQPEIKLPAQGALAARSVERGLGFRLAAWNRLYTHNRVTFNQFA